MRKWIASRKWGHLALILLGVLACLFVAEQVTAVSSRRVRRKTVKGIVTDGQGRVIVGATVYMIDATTVDTTAITPSDIIDGTSEAYDEPLEDIINDPVKKAALPFGITNRRGKFRVRRLVRDGKYFPYVEPPATALHGDGTPLYLPGGDASQTAFIPAGLPRRPGLAIQISHQPPADATYISTTGCTTCHPWSSYKQHAHKLGISVPGVRGGHQDISSHPTFDEFLAKFTPANAYTDVGVKHLFYENYDGSRGFDDWQVFEDAPSGGGPVGVEVYLWKDNADGKYKVTMVNPAGGDPLSPATYNVALTYGGAVFKQRLLLEIPGRKGRYPLLQFQSYSGSISEGDNAFYDRTRTEFRDYHMDWWFTGGTGPLKLPATSKTFEGNCAACHFTGHTTWQDAGTGEVLADAVDDIQGAFDIDGDGTPDEVNIGCEVCHGPGSEHRTQALRPPDIVRRRLVTHGGKAIVNPKLLATGRANLICGRCHDRVKGNGTLGIDDEPLNAANEFPRPGISRTEYLANYVTRKSLAFPGDFWPDEKHTKKHHPQYVEWLRSKHARNASNLLTCAKCHSPHGPYKAPYRFFLKYDPDDPNSLLCQRCHALDVATHSELKTGDNMIGGESLACSKCHMAKAAKTGAGRVGLLVGTPTGGPGDVDLVYWENDISSHLLDVPTKWSVGVLGKQPGKAMPVPYTNRCGTCHDPSALPFQ